MKRNDIYIDYKSQYYLSHHGILGQKWGVRRYQTKKMIKKIDKEYARNNTNYRKEYIKMMNNLEYNTIPMRLDAGYGPTRFYVSPDEKQYTK